MCQACSLDLSCSFAVNAERQAQSMLYFNSKSIKQIQRQLEEVMNTVDVKNPLPVKYKWVETKKVY